MQDEQFVWPKQADIATAQRIYKQDAPLDAVHIARSVMLTGIPWVPPKAKGLIKRLLVSYCGIQGHRGVHVMVKLLDRHFSMTNTRFAVLRFVNKCLCKHVKGGATTQRDWTVDRPVANRNDCLHMNYLFLGESYGDASYVLVLKDELTHYCEMVAADKAIVKWPWRRYWTGTSDLAFQACRRVPILSAK